MSKFNELKWQIDALISQAEQLKELERDDEYGYLAPKFKQQFEASRNVLLMELEAALKNT